jgi:hypothetical protein
VEILTLEVDLVSLDTRATVDRFSCRLDQVDLHLPFFQLHGSIFVFIAIFKLKNEALEDFPYAEVDFRGSMDLILHAGGRLGCIR